jgi:excisionase family DNA binding protein
MTVGEVAEELKLPANRVYKLIRDANDPLPAHRVGRRTIRVRRDELHAWLDERKIVSGKDP